MEQYIIDFLSGAFGVTTIGGVVGILVVSYFRWSLKKLSTKQSADRKKRDDEAKSFKELDRLWRKAVSRILFWIIRGCFLSDRKHRYWNGELTNAWKEFNSIEKAYREQETEIISDRQSEY